jgi:antirestriction protein ArdC
MAELWELHAYPAAFLHIIDTSRLIDLLKDDNRAIFTASSKASQAADYLRSFSETVADPA